MVVGAGASVVVVGAAVVVVVDGDWRRAVGSAAIVRLGGAARLSAPVRVASTTQAATTRATDALRLEPVVVRKGSRRKAGVVGR